MYATRRRLSARSNSEPPFPAPWALKQPPTSVPNERIKSPSGSYGPEESLLRPNADHHRGRPREKNQLDALATNHQSKTDNHAAIEAGLDDHATNTQAPLSPPPAPPQLLKGDFLHPYPAVSIGGHQTPTSQTFWIPFTLTPSTSNTGRLTPINRRVPAHLRAAASALNIKMTYTKSSTGEYIFTQGGNTPATRTPYNERERMPRFEHPIAPNVVPDSESKAKETEVPHLPPQSLKNIDSAEANEPTAAVAAEDTSIPASVIAPATFDDSAYGSGQSSNPFEESFKQTIPDELPVVHETEVIVDIEPIEQPSEESITDMSKDESPSLPSQPVLEAVNAGPTAGPLPTDTPAKEAFTPPAVPIAPEIAPEVAPPPALTNPEAPLVESIKVEDALLADPIPPPAAETTAAPEAAAARDAIPARDAPIADEAADKASAPAPPPPKALKVVAPESTVNASTTSTLRDHPESKPKHRSSKRSSLKGPVEHILNAHVEKSSLAPSPPVAIVGAPRARSNTASEPSIVSAQKRPSSRPAAMRATASRVHAQLAAQGPGGDDVDTDGEPSWAWNELLRQLDEEDERKRRAYACQRPGLDGSVNLDAWWIAFELAWQTNLRKGRGVRTWWDLEKYWAPSEVFAAEEDGAGPEPEPEQAPAPAAEPAPEVKAEEPPVEPAKAAEKPIDQDAANANANGDQTLVSSPEHSPRRSESRNSLKTLAAPGTNQSKRGAAPQAQAQAQARAAPAKDIPEESAGHTTPTSLSSSITSSSRSSRNSSPSRKSRPADSEPQATSGSQQKEGEPALRSSDFRTMWEEAERRWAEEEKANANVDASSSADEVKANALPPKAEPIPATQLPQRKRTAEDRERARDRNREERPSSRANSRHVDTGNGRPPIFQRESYANGPHQQQKEHEQTNVYTQSASGRPSMLTREQSEPSLRTADADDDPRDRRGRDARPKLHIDTDLTDYSQSVPRMPKAKAQPQPQVQPQARAQPPPQAHPVPPQQPPPQAHSQAHSQSRPQSQSKPQQPRARAAAPPMVLRAVPISSDNLNSKVAIAWRAYEARWESMLAPLNREPITFASVPWPVLHPPKAYAEGKGVDSLTTLAIAKFLLSPDHSPGIGTRDRLRAAIRRWHSDKFNRFASRMRSDDRDDEQSNIMEGVGVVARALTQLLELERGD